MKSSNVIAVASMEPKRRLSPWRLMAGVLMLAVVVTGGMFGGRKWMDARSSTTQKPWFGSYVDVTATPRFGFEQMDVARNQQVILSFVVALPHNDCSPAWGGAYSLTQANAYLDLDRRIERLRQQGGDVAVSFGGLKNKELAVSCTDPTKLAAAYRSVIDQYKVNTIDLDLENDSLTDTEAGARRATAIAKLQAERRAAGKHLAVWVTLPVTPQGLSQDGTNAVALLLAKGVDLAGINVMTMDYGQSLAKGESMQTAAEKALTQTQRQLGVLYQQAGITLGGGTLWAKLGATPMIGQNDISGEVFSLADAKGLNSFAVNHKLGRMSMWSANRDLECSSNYADVAIVSDSCSGVKQDKGEFAARLGAGFRAKLAQNAGVVTASEKVSAQQTADDPKTSPYQIWSETGAYLTGTKVVWHHNVYVAKWWTQGNAPDNPVLQSWQTPWDLVGPVLPGERPVPQPTLAPGTYPDWSGTTAYNAGERVLFNGVPYQAKWWNQGQSPAAAASNADGSPWVPLTQAQINEIEAGH